MKKLAKKHFVFDLDDTLTDSYEFNQQMFVDTFVPYLDINTQTEKYLRELHYHARGTSMENQFKKAVRQFSLKQDSKKLVDENELLHIKKVENIKIFESVEEFIQKIKNKNKIVTVMSNRKMSSLRLILNNNGIKKFIDNVISCGDMGHEKPDPFCLLNLIEKSQLPKEQFIFFGDSKTDCEFAQKAGIDFLIIDHYINQKKFYKMLPQLFI